MPRNSASYRALASASRLALLHELQGAERALTADELAGAVGLHRNTVREHLDRLVAAGFVTREPEHRTTRGRPRMTYQVVPRAAGATLDEQLREYLMQVLLAGYGRELREPALEAERAGEEWGRRAPEPEAAPVPEVAADVAGQLAALEMHLDDLGMNPELELDPLRIHLHGCPYAAIARSRPDVVCSVHLGVVRGVLAHHGGPLAADRLEPFVGPDHCILHLSRGTTDQTTASPSGTKGGQRP
ncbi:helix-turn-helix domain-containing protein [Isoptericola sp. b441]|uniref:Helix-turn-helix domain-containing protein n=1 Tax=Actinotalea lenta TaxID=3064654 RepID=A0ABT9D790_9CELL|nr:MULTISPECIES: helix-turn-helix domain-containing protein [unclassified Isoptericola]MDO8106714.1 helix-turn-helix domain-containing protein [Isoptericola sp. b441]MDO8121574.1 helix-turn-helix domain-containing protein [Isoptericola sp. b490]